MTSHGTCLTDDTLLAIAAGDLDEAASRVVHAHVDACAACREALVLVLRNTPDSASPRLAPGQVVSGFRLHAPIGAGGMGVVWSAYHAVTNMPVALKFWTNAGTVVRARREARIAMTLSHPHIIRVHDTFDLEGKPVIVMDWLEGESLHKRMMRDASFGADLVASWMTPVLDALAYAHAQGIIHRDLKPANVFVIQSTPERLCILDFGMAKDTQASHESSSSTRSGTVMGTPRYMAPEQIFGERDLSAAVDVFAAGVILYRLLSGVFPFAASGHGAIIKAHVDGARKPLSAVCPDLPILWHDAIDGALSRDPRQRPTALDMKRALSSV